MEIDKVDKVKEEPHLSGAYIRSLVKQLTSSRTKDSVDGDGDGVQKNLSKIGGESLSDDHSQESSQPPLQPPQHKKQVRRRLHTSRPYQERLLNMAEARREIVTALKFHRASMKQQEANNQDHQSQTHPQPIQPVAQPSLGQEGRSKSRRNPRIYASTASTESTAHVAATNFSNNYLDSYSALTCPPPVPYYWPISAVAAPPPPLIPDNFNLTLPNQPLGLNLNFHDFNNLDTTFLHNPLSMYTSSSSSSPSTSSPTLSIATDEMLAMSEEAAAYSSGGGIMNGSSLVGADLGGGLHHSMDTEEMEELRSISEQHQMEWNDTLNLVTSARWFKFLKTMEIGPEDEKVAHEDDDGGYNPFDQVMEFPPWLINANESCCLQDDHFSEDYLQDPALP